jgi:septin family protein
MDVTKSEKRVLRKFLAEAHIRELTHALERLYEEFRHWESGDIDSFELNERNTLQTLAGS